MPSGPPELHEEFEEPWVAEDILKAEGYNHDGLGTYRFTNTQWQSLSPTAYRAILYLIYEWDYFAVVDENN